jgi:hypothetical protein
VQRKRENLVKICPAPHSSGSRFRIFRNSAEPSASRRVIMKQLRLKSAELASVFIEAVIKYLFLSQQQRHKNFGTAIRTHEISET